MTAAAFRILLGLTLIVVWSAGPTFAVTLAFDENGNSSVGPGALALDPGPGGAAAALTYQLPFSVVPGDVFFGNEPGLVLGGDVVRFNSPVGAAGSTLVFYSDNIPIADSSGDTSAPPGVFYPNQVTIQEIGLEGTNSATYWSVTAASCPSRRAWSSLVSG